MFISDETFAVTVTLAVAAAVAVAAAIDDARTHRIPNSCCAVLVLDAAVGFGVASALGHGPFPWLHLSLGAAVFAGPWLAAHLISPAAIGFGDVKLAAALGLHLGWLSPATAGTALVAASAVFLVATWMDSAPRSAPRPFGPALVTGALLAAAAHLVVIGIGG